jgi:hypothetical protein
MIKVYHSKNKKLYEFKVYCIKLDTSSSDIFQRDEDKPSYILRPERDLISDAILKKGAWEPELVDFAKKFLNRDSNILDIGANIGLLYTDAFSTFTYTCLHLLTPLQGYGR